MGLSDILKDPTGLGAVTENVTKLVGMFFPDKTEEEKGRMAMALTVIQGQLEANKVEASSPSLFIGGWRPAVGWVCVVALAMTFIPKAAVLTALWTYQAFVIIHGWNGVAPVPMLPPYPDLGVTDLIGLMTTLLGMTVMRSLDKSRGVDTTTFAPKDAPALPAPKDFNGTPN